MCLNLDELQVSEGQAGAKPPTQSSRCIESIASLHAIFAVTLMQIRLTVSIAPILLSVFENRFLKLASVSANLMTSSHSACATSCSSLASKQDRITACCSFGRNIFGLVMTDRRRYKCNRQQIQRVCRFVRVNQRPRCDERNRTSLCHRTSSSTNQSGGHHFELETLR